MFKLQRYEKTVILRLFSSEKLTIIKSFYKPKLQLSILGRVFKIGICYETKKSGLFTIYNLATTYLLGFQTSKNPEGMI